jgi:tagatose-1,6-bisphosphate aldolase non-catalytic subunit AgaZ/GatZ
LFLNGISFFEVTVVDNTGEGDIEGAHRVAARAATATAASAASMAGTSEENNALVSAGPEGSAATGATTGASPVETTEAESGLAAIQAHHEAFSFTYREREVYTNNTQART